MDIILVRMAISAECVLIIGLNYDWIKKSADVWPVGRVVTDTAIGAQSLA